MQIPHFHIALTVCEYLSVMDGSLSKKFNTMKEKVKYSSSSFFPTKLSHGGENAPTHKNAYYIVTKDSTCTHLLQVFNVFDTGKNIAN